jgi:hypothetical protein
VLRVVTRCRDAGLLRAEDAELVSLGVGHHDPRDISLAHLDPGCPKVGAYGVKLLPASGSDAVDERKAKGHYSASKV